MTLRHDIRTRFVWLGVFSLCFAFVEASVVVYLRALYYPEGFAFPLRLLGGHHAAIELGREAATMVMLAAVAALSGGNRWQRFGSFMVGFGIWDIGFYGWLKLLLDWPSTMTDWDILFLLPVPWIGPVIAPLLISTFLIVCGGIMVVGTVEGRGIRPGWISWALGSTGTGTLLYSFVSDTAATLRGNLPQPYDYRLLAAGLGLCLLGFLLAWRTEAPPSS